MIEQINFGIYFENKISHPYEIKSEMEKRTLLEIECSLQEYQIKSKSGVFIEREIVNNLDCKINYKSDNFVYFFRSQAVKNTISLAYINNNLIEGINFQAHDHGYLQGVMLLVFRDIGAKNCVYGKIYNDLSIESVNKYSYYTYDEAVKMRGFY